MNMSNFDKIKPGYLVCITTDHESIIPNATHIERDDEMMQFDSDYEAAKQYEQDGGKIIHDMGPCVEDWTYIDTPQNRRLIVAFLVGNPGWPD